MKECPFKVGDRIQSQAPPHSIAIVRAVSERGMEYELENPVWINAWHCWRQGVCLADGFHMWEVIE